MPHFPEILIDMTTTYDADRLSTPTPPENELDLRRIARVLWRSRLLILLIALTGGGLGLAISISSAYYLSQGLFLTPKLTLGEYKQYEVALGNEPRLHQFIEQRGLKGTETAALLQRLVDVPGAMAEAVRPVFSVTGRDAKTYDIRTEQSGDLVGIQLTLRRKENTPPVPITVLAEYLRGTAIRIDLKDAVLDECLKHQSTEQELRNAQIHAEFEVKQEQRRVRDLRALIEQTPGATTIDSRQVVTLEKGAERYLSPTAQLVAAEVAISELGIESARRERQRVAAALRKSHYCGARDLLEEPITGEEFLARLPDLARKVFAGSDLSSDVVEFTANEIEIERLKWVNKYVEKMRFVVAPDGAEKLVRKPGRLTGILGGGALGTVVAILLVLLRAWWRDNREVIVAGDS
jgi:hypothetical protein